MPDDTVATAVTLIRENRTRILAGTTTVLLIAVAVCGVHSWWMLLALGPAIVGAVVAMLGNAVLDTWVDGCNRQFERVIAWADSRPGKFARYFARPVGRGSTWLWANTKGIPHVSVRSGVRLSALVYFWAVMGTLLAAAAYVVVAVVVLVLIIGVVGWLLSLGSNAPTSDPRRPRADEGILRSGGGRGQRLYRNEGLFSESEFGRIDADGRVFKKSGLFSEDEVARVDDSGRVHEKTGMFSEQESHRVDEEGRIFRKTGLFAEEEVGRVASDGRVYRKTGLFSEEEVGRVEDA